MQYGPVSDYTFEPFIEVELDHLTEVHTIILALDEDEVVPIDVKVDGQNCKLLNLDEREFSCTDYPSGRNIRFTAFGHTGKLTICEVEVYGSYGLQWGAWSEWSDCSTECHFGIRERTRECDGDYGVCPGEWHQTAWCNSGPCEKHKNLESS